MSVCVCTCLSYSERGNQHSNNEATTYVLKPLSFYMAAGELS